ncbi:hypothetical protein B9Z65_3176 [Elsinoe australis]|uniref:Choline kinase N-terminal domain-containing protein n=1 Tax=Elsinoe australis TaxID=40998 RepID=A0A2P7ZUL1_9PEZI|nr:hypothetical protein B9Z65_3176 [Elsinoe australis]
MPPFNLIMDSDEDSGVSIAPKSEVISPMMLGGEKDIDDFDLDRRSPRKIRAKGPGSHRLSGRPPAAGSSSSSNIQQWLDADKGGDADGESLSSRSEQHHLFEGGALGKVLKWVRDERVKSAARRARRNAAKTSAKAAAGSHTGDETHEHSHHHHNRRDSEDSVDLDTIEQIIKESLPSGRRTLRRLSQSSKHHRPSVRRLHRASSIAASSDTEYVDGDVLVPSAEVILDNSKTLSYKGGASKSSDNLSLTREPTATEDAWLTFKSEVLRVIHTLRLKGWRRVPLEMSSEVSIERLSGALTNAVYVVSPPDEIPEPPSNEENPRPMPRRKPPKLLLRIYGPQVEHLIDREAELLILRRLARKHIGPRMLGTFQNGRFEEFFNAAPLTPTEMRNPDTSRHIAKRMRELHDGIELLDTEREDGPFVWRNWDKWLARVQKIVEWLDAKVKEEASTDGKEQGFVCGTEWAVFHDTLYKYRQWLEKQCGGKAQLAESLKFAHNDTQYGNILRLLPSSTSPLLLPANSHKQLIVIDFEYANANTTGLEFANHFTEWCYNYHDPAFPWKCTHTLYPTPEDQERFIRAYTRHRPDINVNSPRQDPLDTVPESRAVSPYKASPAAAGAQSTEAEEQRPGSISQTLLHARHPSTGSTTLTPSQASSLPVPSGGVSSSGHIAPRHSSGSGRSAGSAGNYSDMSTHDSDMSSYAEWEDRIVKELMKQTRMWRLANSAQWVAWGIVQAEVPGLPDIGEDGTIQDGEEKEKGGEGGEGGKGGDGEVKVEREAEEGKMAEGLERLEIRDQEGDEGKDGEEMEKVDGEEEEEGGEEFDYLSYARDRAMFFWGDAVEMGFIKEEELPADVRRDIKRLTY